MPPFKVPLSVFVERVDTFSGCWDLFNNRLRFERFVFALVVMGDVTVADVCWPAVEPTGGMCFNIYFIYFSSASNCF